MRLKTYQMPQAFVTRLAVLESYHREATILSLIAMIACHFQVTE